MNVQEILAEIDRLRDQLARLEDKLAELLAVQQELEQESLGHAAPSADVPKDGTELPAGSQPDVQPPAQPPAGSAAQPPAGSEPAGG